MKTVTLTEKQVREIGNEIYVVKHLPDLDMWYVTGEPRWVLTENRQAVERRDALRRKFVARIMEASNGKKR